MEFSRLDQHIRDIYKEIFMTKIIYMGITNSHVN